MSLAIAGTRTRSIPRNHPITTTIPKRNDAPLNPYDAAIYPVMIPAMAKDIYHISSYLYILSFLAAFGFTKSVLNLVSGKISDDIGRKTLLLIGWLVAIPVPFIFYFSTSWNMIVLANIGVGVNQAFAWTMTVTAGLDLSRSTSRGLTVGLNERIYKYDEI